MWHLVTKTKYLDKYKKTNYLLFFTIIIGNVYYNYDSLRWKDKF